MKRFIMVAAVMACGVALSGCTFNIQPAVPSIPAEAESGANLLPCTAKLLVPAAFRHKEYVSSFGGRKITIAVGAPATAAIYKLAKSRFASVTEASVPGNGTVSFARAASSAPAGTVILRPRFAQTSSSVHGVTYEVQFVIALDTASIGKPRSQVGHGSGDAHFYSTSALQSAANNALAGAITDLAAHFQASCPATKQHDTSP